MADLDPHATRKYFAREGTVDRWWTPDSGPLSFHYDAEIRVLEANLTVDPAWRVLDVGTGRGRFGVWFARRGCRVTGIDLNPAMLAAARETAVRAGVADRFDVVEAAAEDLSGFAAAQFDVVLCMEVFDHLPELTRALAQARRVLKDDGRFLFTYVPSESLYGRLGNAYRWLQTRRNGAQLISRTYRLEEVRACLARNGLALERFWGVGLLCVSAQTRLFSDSILIRAATALARAEAARRPYHESSMLARRCAHVVGFARATR